MKRNISLMLLGLCLASGQIYCAKEGGNSKNQVETYYADSEPPYGQRLVGEQLVDVKEGAPASKGKVWKWSPKGKRWVESRADKPEKSQVKTKK